MNPSRNLLLASIPAAVWRRRTQLFQLVPFEAGHVFYRAGDSVTQLTFPVRGLVSLRMPLAGGQFTEVAMVGREGFLGLPLIFGQQRSAMMASAQTGGDAFAIHARDFHRLSQRHAPLVSALHLYTNAMLDALAQCSVCNQAHRIEQKCARWMLMAADRLESPTFSITQESLSATLGVRRASITHAAERMREQGLIRYHRGRITILERRRLENFACPCYRAIREAFDRLAPGSRVKR
jgi:CRP-like cAMP-binding protein